MPCTPRILVVGSPERLRFFSHYLELLGDQVNFVSDDFACSEALTGFCPDLLIYETGAPLREGAPFVRTLRSASDVPILFIGDGNCRAAQALDAGADQVFIGKIELDDLVASVNALLRRCPRVMGSASFDVGDFHFCVDTHRCTLRGHALQLTSQEFKVLTHMARHPYKVLTHEELSGAAWGASQSPAFLRPLILALRKAIEPDPANPIYIITEFKAGYRFVPSSIESFAREAETTTAA